MTGSIHLTPFLSPTGSMRMRRPLCYRRILWAHPEQLWVCWSMPEWTVWRHWGWTGLSLSQLLSGGGKSFFFRILNSFRDMQVPSGCTIHSGCPVGILICTSGVCSTLVRVPNPNINQRKPSHSVTFSVGAHAQTESLLMIRLDERRA